MNDINSETWFHIATGAAMMGIILFAILEGDDK